MPELAADLQALLDRVAEGAAHACAAGDTQVWFIEHDQAQRLAHFGSIEVAGAALSPIGPDAPVLWPLVQEHRTIYTRDVRDLPKTPRISRQIELGVCTLVLTPMLAMDRVLGFIQARSDQVAVFTDEQIAQPETYAALVAVAIDRAQLARDNARLIEELEGKTREQAEALEQQR